MAAIALVTVSALILGLSPGLALMCGALGMIALDRYDPGILDRVIGRR